MQINKYNFKKISEYIWEIPKSFRSDMLIPARVYATEGMLRRISKDRSIEQIINVATLPGVLNYALIMPDAHEGYGFPIGGVAAMSYPDGIISPGGIGYDINCGVRLLLSNLSYDDIKADLKDLLHDLNREIPSGVGRGGRNIFNKKEINEILEQGVPWALKHGYALEEDLKHIESGGNLKDAEAKEVSGRAKKRGTNQLGTLGAGNHFIEIDLVEEIFDPETAKIFGMKKNQIVILIHTGSRGLGHQVATDYIKEMLEEISNLGIELKDRELVGVPFSSDLGSRYFKAMSAAANFAWVNRQLITYGIRRIWSRRFGKKGNLKLLYDVAHNIAKLEEYEIDGKITKVIMHRKGATRAFGPGEKDIPEIYKTSGQPVIIPGSMGTASYVLAGTEIAMRDTFGSTCHGAGRSMSRHEAKKKINIDDLKENLAKRKIIFEAGSVAGLVEEAPEAYKDINEVIRVVHETGIARKVAKLRPLGVIKG